METMIFLAVSGALFLSAMLLVNGQQRKTEFANAVRDFDSKLQSIVNNVASGYYSNTGQTTCNVSGGVITSITTGGTNQGQNSDCTFIGQVIVPSASGDKVTIYSTAGLRLDPSGKEVQDLAGAKPKLITATSEDYVFPGGITMSMKIGGANFSGSLGTFTTFNPYNGSGALASGSSRSDLYAINPPANISIVESNLAAGAYQKNPNPSIKICLTDGQQVGVIELNTGSTRVTIGNTCP